MTTREITASNLKPMRGRIVGDSFALAPPPLENGDRLTRAEFERRYEAMPHIKKAELIEGVVHMPSPVRLDHSRPHARLVTWLGIYQESTPGADYADNSSVRLDADNEYQPDVVMWIESKHGGKSRVTDDGYLEGPPELVVEVSASSASYDLHEKRRVYRRVGVQEYLVWQVYDEHIDWFELSEGEYKPLPADENGVVRSRVFPGLHLSTRAILADDLAQVLAELQRGLAGEEHAPFVARLASA